MAWYHEYDGGRAYYTALGHTVESYLDPLFLRHIQGALTYVIGGNGLDYGKSVSQRVPEENRFSKVVLADSLDEPTELAIMDDETVLFIQRKGEIKKYDPLSGEVTQINKIDVYHDQEDGLMGLTLDPNFNENHWVYMYYSPKGDEAKQHLSRFEYKDGNVNLETEIVLLEVKTQRNECCHTGGSLTWDRAGNLYLSTGDDTNPFESDGYGPIDERPGHEPFDGQRSSGNTNDLRGKILRIHPEPDGTYTIPEGNLFPVGTDGTRPEIYVMGNRNPYRISVDQRTGYLYWGEVGPDANADSVSRGPRGYDEVNQARKAGNFGWPHFVGDNQAYNRYDFASSSSGPEFDENAPLNTSPNNTGIQNLPPANPAFIWYPYGESREFPEVGTGGRNAMAGPVYYSEDYENKPDNALPSYFDGKLFIYDWIRGWIFAVTMAENGDFESMEPFMENTKFNNPMDMEMASNGVMYMLEYGTGWYSQNQDARLIRIDYNGGNRLPSVMISATPEKGGNPLEVQFSSRGTFDPDGDELSFKWDLGDGTQSSETDPIHTFSEPGIYYVSVNVSDGKVSSNKDLEIWAGNEPAEVSINISGNQTFYWKGKSIEYAVTVRDTEDGTLAEGQIDESSVLIGADLVDREFDVTKSFGHKLPLSFVEGKRLIDDSDCLACHKIQGESIGPEYLSVAAKYREEGDAVVYLAEKIISGGSGVWGEVAMAAHPNFSMEDAGKIAEYILALGTDGSNGLPVKGSYVVDDENTKSSSKLVIRASYADNGNGNIPSILSENMVVLRPSILGAKDFENGDKYQAMDFPGVSIVLAENDAWMELRDIDLSGISKIKITGSLIGIEDETDLKFEIEGTDLGQVPFQKLGPEGPQPGTFPSIAEIPVASDLRGTLTIRLESTVNSGPAAAIVTIEFIK